jgi:dTDP-3-amino-3,4,6-trideoxy-alpha-D-glucose transaminase
MTIPFNDLRAQYLAHKAEIDAAVGRVLDSGWYILGREVSAFEQEFAAFCGAAECVGVNSGTDALVMALRACGIGPGDEVITVAHSAVATVAAIALTGALPVLVEIDPATYTMSPNALAQAISPATKAVIPVHLYGHPAEMDAILAVARRAGLFVIEDCAQAHGALYKGQPIGTLGDLGCFSFYPTKNLGALGDGGALIGSDRGLIENARMQREYGWTPNARYVSNVPGMNSRLDELQAAILRVRLQHLTEENEMRRRLAARYAELLVGQAHLPIELPGNRHVYHLYVLRTAHRDLVRERMTALGVGTAIHYPVPIHRQPAYQNGNLVAHDLHMTEQIAGEILSLPLNPYLSDEQIGRVADAFIASRVE